MNRFPWPLMLVFACCAPIAALAAPPGPGFRGLPAGSVEQQAYLQARELAVDLVGDALPRMTPAQRRMGLRVARELRGARFLASTDASSRKLCRDRRYSLFVNASRPDVIFICDEVRPHARRAGDDAIARLAQGFIHEGVHLAGEMDECAATGFELAVMRRTIGIRSEGSQLSYGALCLDHGRAMR